MFEIAVGCDQNKYIAVKGQVYLHLTCLTIFVSKPMVNEMVIISDNFILMTDMFIMKSKIELTMCPNQVCLNFLPSQVLNLIIPKREKE